MFTYQVFSFAPQLGYNRCALIGVLLTHAPNHFQTQATLTVKGTILAGSCLPCYTKRESSIVLPTRIPQSSPIPKKAKRYQHVQLAQAGHYLHEPCDQVIKYSNWV